MDLAAVAGVGHAGFLAGPPFVGLAAEAVGLGPALAIVPGLALLIALMAGLALRVSFSPPTVTNARAAGPATAS